MATPLDHQIGYGEESAYGTFTAPTRYLEMNEESLTLDEERVESEGFRAGNNFLRADRRKLNRKGVSGDVVHEITSSGFSLLLKHCLGGVPVITTPGGATLSRDHTIDLGDLSAIPSLTTQVGRFRTGDAVEPFSYLGCKVAEWEISAEIDGLLMLRMTLDGQNESVTDTLGTASYAAADEVFVYHEGDVQIGGASTCVKSFSISGNNALKTDRHFICPVNGSLKREPLQSGRREITGTLDMEFETMTEVNRFRDATTFGLDVIFTGSEIESGYNNSLTLDIGLAEYLGDTPVVAGQDVIEHSMNFRALDDGSSNPFQAIYRTADTTE